MSSNNNHNTQQSQQQFKVVLLGEGCVGKTSLVLRYCHNKFLDNHSTTLQASFLTKKLIVNNTKVTLFIWDTAGQEKFHALAPIYYRDSNGALLVYDVTDADSLSKVKIWVKELRKMLGSNVALAIVGNKIDLLPAHQQNNYSSNELIAEAQSYSASTNASHYCTSAESNRGIDELFLDLTKKMLAQSQSQEHAQSRSSTFASTSRTLTIVSDNTDNINDDTNRKNKCC